MLPWTRPGSSPVGGEKAPLWTKATPFSSSGTWPVAWSIEVPTGAVIEAAGRLSRPSPVGVEVTLGSVRRVTERGGSVSGVCEVAVGDAGRGARQVVARRRRRGDGLRRLAVDGVPHRRRDRRQAGGRRGKKLLADDLGRLAAGHEAARADNTARLCGSHPGSPARRTRYRR